MDIFQVKARQNELNVRLAKLIWDELKEFTDETGVSVKSINVDFVNVTECMAVMPKFIAASAQTELAL